MTSIAGSVIAASFIVFGLESAEAATLTHLWELNNTLTDSVGGVTLTSNGGTLAPTGYTFGDNKGLSASGIGIDNKYTIDMSFKFDEATGYQRIIDFKNLTSDTGLYTLGNTFNFYNVTSSAPGSFAANTFYQLTLTRTNAGIVNLYVDHTFLFGFDDSASELARFTAAGNIAHFFQDDFAVGGESAPGFVDYIRIYDDALTERQIAGLTPPGAVPLPAGGVLLLSALFGSGLLAGRRKRS